MFRGRSTYRDKAENKVRSPLAWVLFVEDNGLVPDSRCK
jgi:hypothetical protein